ncbi:hypothetical protein OG21DRAFT_1488220 [Imleria badia]|nr:hypothetical protein OG21DRAFT_1488220 [Imleria badia]
MRTQEARRVELKGSGGRAPGTPDEPIRPGGASHQPPDKLLKERVGDEVGMADECVHTAGEEGEEEAEDIADDPDDSVHDARGCAGHPLAQTSGPTPYEDETGTTSQAVETIDTRTTENVTQTSLTKSPDRAEGARGRGGKQKVEEVELRRLS